MSDTKKSPFLAGLLSVMPGLGQVYVGYYVSGFVNILVVAGTIAVLNSMEHHHSDMEAFFGLFLGFFWLFNVVDATRKASLYNLYQTGERPEKLPTDSPLVGGAILLLVGLLFTLKFTLGLDMDWLQHVWPLGLVLGGAYLIWKYRRMQRELRAQRNIRSIGGDRSRAGDESETGQADSGSL
jgi:hypothetical protein